MWYKNITGRFFGLVTKHACDGRTDGQNYDSQNRASTARVFKIGNGNRKGKQTEIIQIIHTHAYTVPKSTSESQAHQTYLLTYGPGARMGNTQHKQLSHKPHASHW